MDWCLNILKELPGVENQLMERGSCLTRFYTTTLSLYIVGVLRKYHTIFLLNPSDVVTAFEQLSKIAYKPKLPIESGTSMLDCNSAEWCILAYLHDLSLNCSTLRDKNREKFSDLKRLFSNVSIFNHFWIKNNWKIILFFILECRTFHVDLQFDGQKIWRRIHRQSPQKSGPSNHQTTYRKPSKSIQFRLQRSDGSLWRKYFCSVY